MDSKKLAGKIRGFTHGLAAGAEALAGTTTGYVLCTSPTTPLEKVVLASFAAYVTRDVYKTLSREWDRSSRRALAVGYLIPSALAVGCEIGSQGKISEHFEPLIKHPPSSNRVLRLEEIPSPHAATLEILRAQPGSALG